jgi:hypothetical protein
MQNRASGGAVAPQVAQRCASASPQTMQKRASGGFSVEHEGQLFTAAQPTIGELQRTRFEYRLSDRPRNWPVAFVRRAIGARSRCTAEGKPARAESRARSTNSAPVARAR